MGRNGYPAEFRRKALDLLDAGRAVRDVARDLEISEQSIYTWRGQDRIDKGLVGGLKIPESQHAHSRKSQRDSIIGTIRPRRVRHERV